MGTVRPLNQPFANVTLDGSGNGVASLGPVVARLHWQPSSVSVSVATHALEARCSVFFGSTLGSATFLSTTFTGSSGDTCGTSSIPDMQPGMQLWAKWTGGDPGAVATMVVNGTYSQGAPS